MIEHKTHQTHRQVAWVAVLLVDSGTHIRITQPQRHHHVRLLAGEGGRDGSAKRPPPKDDNLGDTLQHAALLAAAPEPA